MKRFSALAALVAITASLFISSATFAQDTGQALEIAPPLVSLKSDPGKTIQTKISIRNIARGPLIVTGQVNDFSSQGEDGIPQIAVDEEEQSPYSIIDWVGPLSQLTLAPNELKDLPITVNVPSNASPGGYYGVIRFTATPGELDASGVSLSASIGALVFIRINGDANESMEIEEFFASKDGRKGWFFDRQPIDFVQRIKNTGNVQQQPVGRIVVKDMFGKNIVNLNLNLDQRNVLPDSIRRFEVAMDKSAIGDRILFGLYTAELTSTFGEDGQTVSQTIRFFVLPWQIILGALIVIAAAIGGFRYWLHHHDQSVGGRRRGSRRRR